MMRQAFTFGVVGAAAAGTHLLVLWLLRELAGVPPLAGNVVAFLVAFQVSFFGHHRWTFKAAKGHERRLARTYLRFFAVAVATGFLLNEALYAVLLSFDRLAAHPVAVQAAVQVAVAGVTFFAGKLWAFRSGKANP